MKSRLKNRFTIEASASDVRFLLQHLYAHSRTALPHGEDVADLEGLKLGRDPALCMSRPRMFSIQS